MIGDNFLAVSLVKSGRGLCLGLFLFLSCKKEYSCEGCRPLPEIVLPPIRIIPNELITSCDISIQDESKLKWIYPEVRTKLWPGHHWIFDSIRMDGSKQYKRTYDLKKYLEMDKYKIGDSFFVRYEIRWRFQSAEYVQEDTLVF